MRHTKEPVVTGLRVHLGAVMMQSLRKLLRELVRGQVGSGWGRESGLWGGIEVDTGVCFRLLGAVSGSRMYVRGASCVLPASSPSRVGILRTGKSHLLQAWTKLVWVMQASMGAVSQG